MKGVLQSDVLPIARNPSTGWICDRPAALALYPLVTDPDVDTSSLTPSSARARDSEGHQVLLFENEWSIRLALERNKGLELNELPPLSEEF